MELDSSSLNGVQVISVMADRIDSAGAIRFKDAVRAVVDEDAPRVVLDLGRVGFVDSSGLGAIVAVMKFLGPERKLDLAALTLAIVPVLVLYLIFSRQLIRGITSGAVK